jgi:hypothetical protein
LIKPAVKELSISLVDILVFAIIFYRHMSALPEAKLTPETSYWSIFNLQFSIPYTPGFN